MPFLGTLPSLPYNQTGSAGLARFAETLEAAKRKQAESALSQILAQALAQPGDPQASALQGIQGYNAARPTGLGGILDAINPTTGGPLPTENVLAAMFRQRMADPEGLSQQYAQERLTGAQQENEARGLALEQTRSMPADQRAKRQRLADIKQLLSVAMQQARNTIPGSPEAEEAAAEMRELADLYRQEAGLVKTATPAAPSVPSPPTQTSDEGPAWFRQMRSMPQAEAAQPTTRPAGKKLDPTKPDDYRVMQDILRRAGGDRKKALALATQEGYTF